MDWKVIWTPLHSVGILSLHLNQCTYPALTVKLAAHYSVIERKLELDLQPAKPLSSHSRRKQRRKAGTEPNKQGQVLSTDEQNDTPEKSQNAYFLMLNTVGRALKLVSAQGLGSSLGRDMLTKLTAPKWKQTPVGEREYWAKYANVVKTEMQKRRNGLSIKEFHPDDTGRSRSGFGHRKRKGNVYACDKQSAAARKQELKPAAMKPVISQLPQPIASTFLSNDPAAPFESLTASSSISTYSYATGSSSSIISSTGIRCFPTSATASSNELITPLIACSATASTFSKAVLEEIAKCDANSNFANSVGTAGPPSESTQTTSFVTETDKYLERLRVCPIFRLPLSLSFLSFLSSVVT
jgi:hypothetical protein